MFSALSRRVGAFEISIIYDDGDDDDDDDDAHRTEIGISSSTQLSALSLGFPRLQKIRQFCHPTISYQTYCNRRNLSLQLQNQAESQRRERDNEGERERLEGERERMRGRERD